MTEDSPAQAKEKPKRPQRSWKRKLRRWAYFLGIFALLLYLIDGPIARWGIKRYLGKTLDGIGLSGDFDLSGNLVYGFTISDARLDGERSVRKLHFKEAKIQYDLQKLIDEYTVNVLQVEGLDLVVDIDYRSPPERRPPDPPTTWEILSNIQPYIVSNPIDIRDAQVTLVQGPDETFARFDLGQLSHPAGDEVIRLRNFVSTRRGGATPVQQVAITWQPSAMYLDHWEVLAELAAWDVMMAWKGEELTAIEGRARLARSRFDVTYLPDGTIEFQQSGQPFNSKDVEHLIGLDLPARFQIDAVKGEIDDFHKAFPHWKLIADARLSHLQWDQIQVDQAELKLEHQNGHSAVQLKARADQGQLNFEGEADWLEADREDWAGFGKARAQVEVSHPDAWTQRLQALLPAELLEFSEGQIAAEANLAWHEGSLSEVDATTRLQSLKWRGHTLPELHASLIQIAGERWSIQAQSGSDSLKLMAELSPPRSHYAGELILKSVELEWLNPLLGEFVPYLKLSSPPSLTWKGEGQWHEAGQHSGLLQLESASANWADLPHLQASGEALYQWPESIEVQQLAASYGDFQINGDLSWREEEAQLKNFSIADTSGPLLQAELRFPLTLEVDSLKSLLELEGPVDCELRSSDMALQRLWKLLNLDDDSPLAGISGNSQLELKLGGDFQNPDLQGALSVDRLRGLAQEKLAPLSGRLNFNTEGGKLSLKGELDEGDRESVSLEAKLPFAPRQWLEEPELLETLPLDASARIDALPLERVLDLIPSLSEEIKALTGEIDLTVSLVGPLNELDWKAETDVTVDEFRFIKNRIPRIEQLRLRARYEENQLSLEEVSAQVGGGRLSARGEAEISGIRGFELKPELGAFQVDLDIDHAPVYRDDQVLVRANGDLTVQGQLDQATISGRIGIVESLFFKDIELIPLGVPSSTVDAFELPEIDAAGERLTIPAPFDNWKLDLVTQLDDPLLIRGNLAQGQISGRVKVGGTLAQPRPDGTLKLDNILARLPFSRLKVTDSAVRFTPSGGLTPQLDVRGRSFVNNTEVNIYAYGPVSKPTITFTSNPPLPEAEIMTLLASGTTTQGLEDQDVASAKAFQFLLAELRQRSEKPGGNRLFAGLLSVLDNIDVNIGQSGAFTNRRYNAATIRFSERWNFTAMLDREGNARGLVVFSIRFK